MTTNVSKVTTRVSGAGNPLVTFSVTFRDDTGPVFTVNGWMYTIKGLGPPRVKSQTGINLPSLFECDPKWLKDLTALLESDPAVRRHMRLDERDETEDL